MSKPRHAGSLALLCTLMMACALTKGGPLSQQPASSDAKAPSAAPESTPKRWSYLAKPNTALTQLDVHLCWQGPAPAVWKNTSDGASGILLHAADPATGSPLRIDGNEIHNKHGAADGCLDYTLDLTAMERSGGFMAGTHVGDTRVMSSARWLWRPAHAAIDPGGGDDIEMQIEFELPAGMDVAVPWPRVGDPASRCFRVDSSVFQMRSYTVLGKSERQTLEVAGGRFDVVIADAPHAATPQGIEAWLSAAGSAVADLYEGFPVSNLQILILPVPGWRDEAVVFGMTARGGGSGLILLLNANASDDELVGEWVAVHEMLHLGMPFVQRTDAWFSEGYATYYQQVVRSRAGLLRDDKGSTAADQTLEVLRILAGGIGRARSRSGASLRKASARMFADGGFQQVYWGGAALWMRLDIALRKATAGEHSADDLVRALHGCCAAKGGIWSAEQLTRMAAKKADLWAPNGAKLVNSLVDRALSWTEMPDAPELFEGLAVAPTGEKLRLLSAPEADAARRASIFAPR